MSDNGRNPGNGFGAQGDEMPVHGHDQEVAAFAREVHDLYVRAPAPALAERHLAAILAEAEDVTVVDRDLAVEPVPVPLRRPAPRLRWSLVRRLAAVALVTLVAGAGLALAGVRPLDPLRDALQGVGILEDDESGEGPSGSAAQNAHGGDGDASPAGRGENSSNDGATPGAKHAADAADEGQATAEQARSGETPPDTPGRSGDHPQPQGAPPADPGPPDEAPQGPPDSPRGQGSGQGQGAEQRPAEPPTELDE
jgi:hypothetical protein